MGKKVLIVDDAAFMRMMLKDILQKNDFEVVAEAENGKVGVAAYQKFKPDIVTMDITMPEMNGIDAVKAIKAFDAECFLCGINWCEDEINQLGQTKQQNFPS